MRKEFIYLAMAMAVPTGIALSSPVSAAEQEAKNIPAAPEGKGQIVFYRTGGPGFAMGCAINENGEKISSLGAGKYFMMVAEPGPHSFTVQSEAKDVLNVEVEPDETQYVRCKIKMGFLMGRPNISPSDEKKFGELSHKMKMVDEDDMGPRVRRIDTESSASAKETEPAG